MHVQECDAHCATCSFKPQTQQGADILAQNLNVQILMPDFFEPEGPWPVDKFPPQTDEEKAKWSVLYSLSRQLLTPF